MRRMKPGAAAMVLFALSRNAEAADCAKDEAELRASLTHESAKAETWNFAWRWTFTGAAVVSLSVGLADFDFLRDSRVGLFVSAGKAGIGAMARWILPLHIRVPAATGDACADLALLHREQARVAKKQRGLFFTGHAGGILLNAVGGYIVYRYSGVGQAALSVGVGYPVGLISNYTMPRDSWQRWRDTTVVVTPTDGGGAVSLVGAF